jgi:bifunctional UDP-N-acetylglucosamine pyrophosphorylase/glucosamine-1-phosphate N-acetyltransferase
MEPNMETIAIILAAGQGTRMKSILPKVLHPLLGRPLAAYSVEMAALVCGRPPLVVVGHGAGQVRQALGASARYVVQAEQLGTGHAVLQAEVELADFAGLVLIISADMPLLRAETIAALAQTQASNPGPLSLLTVSGPDPRGFGRIVRDADGGVTAIVEEAAATPEQLVIREYNVGAYCVRADWLWQALKRIKRSPKGEYYLTDIVQLAVEEGQAVVASPVAEPVEALGINTRAHLAEAAAAMRARVNLRWMEAGVAMIDPGQVYIEPGVTLAPDTTLWPGTYLKGSTSIGSGCEIGPDTIIESSTVGNDCRILSSVLEFATLEDHVEMGPFCHLRKGAHLASHVHMGNFGEVKDSYLGEGTKMGHFSYIGNATIAGDVNIGAGTITCNYDGEQKHPTEIGEGAFIGSDTMLVAPVKIGKGARTGAGSVVNRDVAPGDVVVGVPARPLRKADK